MNMRAVFLRVMADALGSVIVIISALLNIYQEKIGIPKHIAVHIDPTLSLLLVGLILVSTIPLGKLDPHLTPLPSCQTYHASLG